MTGRGFSRAAKKAYEEYAREVGFHGPASIHQGLGYFWAAEQCTVPVCHLMYFGIEKDMLRVLLKPSRNSPVQYVVHACCCGGGEYNTHPILPCPKHVYVKHQCHPFHDNTGMGFCKPNLHYLVCRVPLQLSFGLIWPDNELWVERAVQLFKSMVKGAFP